MDPLDKERPWGRWVQLVLITLVIGVIYLVFRWAVVVPEWGWRLIIGGTLSGTALYFLLMIGTGTAEAGEKEAGRERLRTVLSVLVVAALTLPVWVLLYIALTGEKLP